MGSSLSARLREARHPHGDSSGGALAPHEESSSVSWCSPGSSGRALGCSGRLERSHLLSFALVLEDEGERLLQVPAADEPLVISQCGQRRGLDITPTAQTRRIPRGDQEFRCLLDIICVIERSSSSQVRRVFDLERLPDRREERQVRATGSQTCPTRVAAHRGGPRPLDKTLRRACRSRC